jgi:ATP-binding cassette, subfamily B, bacterial MsbA
MAVLAACVTTTAYFIGTVVNATTLERDFHSVLLICTAIFLVKGLAQYAQAILLTRTHARMTASYQSLLFDRLLLESIHYLSSVHSSETMHRLRMSAEAPAKVMDMTICAIGREGLSIIGLTAVMVYQDPLLSLGCLLAAPIIFAAARSSRARLDDMTLRSVRAHSRTTEMLQETLQSMRLIKTFGLEPSIRDRAHRKIESVREADQKIARLYLALHPLGRGPQRMHRCLDCSLRQLSHHLPESDAGRTGLVPDRLRAGLRTDQAAGAVSCRRHQCSSWDSDETLGSGPSEPSDNNKPEFVLNEGHIVLDDATFSYRDDIAVLRGLSLPAAPRQITARVGHSGSGKSTIFNLLLRLYEYGDGAIMIDDQNIATFHATPQYRLSRAGHVSVSRHDWREHRGRAIGRKSRSNRRRRTGRPRARFHREFSSRL